MKHLKKYAVSVFVILMIGCLTACGNTGTEEVVSDVETTESEPKTEVETGTGVCNNEIATLMGEGFNCVMSSCSEQKWQGVFTPEDEQTAEQADGGEDILNRIYLVSFEMTDEEQAEFDEICAMEEDNESLLYNFLGTRETVNVTEITDRIPLQKDLDLYLGKTFADLEAEGYENTGYSGDEESGSYTFYFDGPEYALLVTPTADIVIKDIDDYSVNDVRAFEIGSVSFAGFSFGIFEE